MLKVFMLLVSGFTILTSHAQNDMTATQVDSIVATIDTDHLLASFKSVDSSNVSAETGKVIVYNYQKQKNTGQIEKIERIGNGTCDSKEQYYFVNGNLLKAVIDMRCDGIVAWDSELYYADDIAFWQTDKGDVLYGPAFKQTAYHDLKRILELEKEK